MSCSVMKERYYILSMSAGLSCVIPDVNNIITFRCTIPLMSYMPQLAKVFACRKERKNTVQLASST